MCNVQAGLQLSRREEDLRAFGLIALCNTHRQCCALLRKLAIRYIKNVYTLFEVNERHF